MYKIKMSGTWANMQKLLDCSKIRDYTLIRAGNNYTMYLRELPPYINLYENILHIQQGGFTEIGEREL
jgi:hypothetical protein